MFGVRCSNFLEVGIKIEIHSNSMPSKGEFKVLSGHRQNYRQFSFFHCSNGNFGGSYLQLTKGQISFFVGGVEGIGQCIGRIWRCSVYIAYPRLSDWTSLQ